MPMLRANDADFYYEIHGSGYPLILIAGYACDHTSWIPVLEGLSKHFQVLIFDNRAVGQTKDDGRPLTAELMAEDVIAIADQLKLNKPHIAGHSLGGIIVQSAATQYPDKIGKACILSSTGKWREAAMLGFQVALKLLEKGMDLDFVIDAILPWMFSDAFLQNKKNINSFKAAIVNNPYLPSLFDQRRQYEALAKWNGGHNLNKINAETLIISGDADIVVLPHEAENLANNIPNSRQVSFQCGHVVMIEVPQFLTIAMIDFLNRGI